jgi:hypothetical protein
MKYDARFFDLYLLHYRPRGGTRIHHGIRSQTDVCMCVLKANKIFKRCVVELPLILSKGVSDNCCADSNVSLVQRTTQTLLVLRKCNSG